MKVKQMREIAEQFNVTLKFGDYPYAAWYDKVSFDNKEWEGMWFTEEPININLFIPKTYNMNERVFGFFHELGHIMDHYHGVEFETTWDCEVSAWRWAWIFCRTHGYVDKLAFREDVTHCLGTYNKEQNYELIAALEFIGLW
ncbi:MAG: hypothetical protein JXR12_05895 [Neptunomonas phycophila]